MSITLISSRNSSDWHPVLASLSNARSIAVFMRASSSEATDCVPSRARKTSTASLISGRSSFPLLP